MHWYFIIGAALGSVLRYLTDFYFPRHGILIVNIIGSCLAGIVLGMTWNHVMHQEVAAILLGGFAGSLTTYSTVALTTAQQHPGALVKAITLWLQHVGFSTLACILGLVCSIQVLS